MLLGSCGLFGDKKEDEQQKPEKVEPKTSSAWDAKIGPTGAEAHADRIGAASIDTLAMGGPASSPKIADYLADPSPKVRTKAIKTLAGFGKEAEPGLPKIFEILRNVEPDIRAAAAEALARIGHEAAVKHLERACGDKHPRVKIWAHAGLGHLGKDCQEHYEKVADLLAAGGSPIPAQAAEALGFMDCATREGFETLVGHLGSSDEDVVVAAARALGYIGPKAAGAVPRLMKMLEGKSWRKRQAGLLALAKMGAKAAPAVGQLIEMLSDPAPRFRELAAHTLGSIGPLAKSAVDALKKLTIDQEATVQAAAKRALARILAE